MRCRGSDKILLPLGGQPVFARTVSAFHASGCVDEWVIVYRDAAQEQALRSCLVGDFPIERTRWTTGGSSRAESVRNGLAQLSTDITRVLIHDGARPLIRLETIAALCRALESAPAVITAHRSVDTIKRVPDPDTITQCPQELETLPRETLWAMETPQGFERELICRAYRDAAGDLSDDAAAVEALGQPVQLLENPYPNPKLTTPEDLHLMESLLDTRTALSPDIRIGFGYDIHRFAEGRRLVLGGVEIPSPKGLDGHSDADVLVHALADAVLGACGLSDIGTWFPNDDPSIAGIDSIEILAKAIDEAQKQGFGVGNVDAALIAESPKISPHLEAMKQRLAPILGVELNAVGIKATTHERIGALGRGEGIAAQAVVLLTRPRRD